MPLAFMLCLAIFLSFVPFAVCGFDNSAVAVLLSEERNESADALSHKVASQELQSPLFLAPALLPNNTLPELSALLPLQKAQGLQERFTPPLYFTRLPFAILPRSFLN